MQTTDKRFVPIAAYQREYGGSYQTIKHALDSGQLNGVKTPGGKWLIDTQDTANPDTSIMMAKLDQTSRLVEKLAAHLGMKV